jgi:hypothetical protein
MIGSISKIRPCGHHHHYKYAHAKNVDDVNRIDASYKNDTKDDYDYEFNYNLENITNANSMFMSGKYIRKINIIMPKVTNADSIFRGTHLLTSVKIEAPRLTSVGTMIYGSINLTDFEMDTRKITFFAYFGERAPLKRLNLAMGNATNINNAFMKNTVSGIGMVGSSATVMESALPKVTTANSAFAYLALTETKYPVDVNGNCIWDSLLPQHVIEGVPQYKYLTLPKLTSGDTMFNGARLNKESIISILNSLPTYTSGTHKLTIGCHIDHKYDPEVNIAIKKCQNSYITPIEEIGAILPEEVTENKKWTIIVQWNGTATENAYPAPTV